MCDGLQDLIYEFAMKEVRRLGAGGFMTEFGALDDLPNGIDNIVNLLSTLLFAFMNRSFVKRYKEISNSID